MEYDKTSKKKEREQKEKTDIEGPRLPAKLIPKKREQSKSKERHDLYQTGMLWMKEKSQKVVELQSQQLDKEILGVSFKPTINRENDLVNINSCRAIVSVLFTIPALFNIL